MEQNPISDAAQEHIRAFAKAFLKPERRQRFVEMLCNPKQRSRYVGHLYHMLGFELKESRSHEQPPADLARLCAGRQVYLIGGGQDDKFATFDDAMAVLENDGGGIISIIPGRLALWKEESPSTATWLY